jgi:flavin-dependent dehydrogenase
MASGSNLLEVDVFVVGAGPAGATAALNLAPSWRTALADLHAEPCLRIGESLLPAARRLLTDMGLWERFLGERHAPWYHNRAVWGSADVYETDFLRDPDGHGWHLDRARFESWLRGIAVERGATLLAPARLIAVHRHNGAWRIRLQTPSGQREAVSRFLIDAGGRAAPLASRLGARRRVEGRLVCRYLYGTDQVPKSSAGFTFVEAVEDGWWYTAPFGGGRRVLAFHSDADLPAAYATSDPKVLLERARSRRELGAVLSDSRFVPGIEFGVTAAHSAILAPLAGSDWCATGDAALSFDPLSSQGLLNALFTGLAAAEAADRSLCGDISGLSDYCGTLDNIYGIYRQHLAHYYGAERRWARSPFWQRRSNTVPGPQSESEIQNGTSSLAPTQVCGIELIRAVPYSKIT